MLHSHRLIVIISAFLLLVGCDKKDVAAPSGPMPVTTLELKSKTIPYVVEVVGRTEGSKEVEVRARVSGILEKRLYSEGSKVAAGTPLFRIDPAPYEIALDRARASLAEEQARNQQVKRNSERIKELFAKNLISRNDADNALSALEASDAALLRAQTNVREAELNLSYTRVTAPIAGITGRALRSDGSLVTAGTESGLLTTVSQANPIWVRFALSAGEDDALRNATKSTSDVAVTLIHGNRELDEKGRVNFAASTVDAALGTVQLRAEFANAALSVLPGEYVRVRLSGGKQQVVTVPQTAVLQGAKGPFVWLVNGEQKVEQRAIKTGAWVGDEWRVLEGLEPGDVIVLDNLLKLKSGQAVKSQAIQPKA